MANSPRRDASESCPLHAVDGVPLSEAAELTLRRARLFLRRVCTTAWQPRALLLGYTPKTHDDGLALVAWVAGDLEFDSWRRLRALRPPSDPDLPREIAELRAFADEWSDRCHFAALSVSAPRERARIFSHLASAFPSTAWRVTSIIEVLVGFAARRSKASEELLQQLCSDGLRDAIAGLMPTLRKVREAIRTAVIGDEEIGEIHWVREQFAGDLAAWLEERRHEFGKLPRQDKDALGLGMALPAWDARLGGSDGFVIAAKA